MKEKTTYSKAPDEVVAALKQAELIEDFLPSPEKLVLREDSIKVTISLSKRSVNFFKRKAKETHVPYQKMIKTVIDIYAGHFLQKPTPKAS